VTEALIKSAFSAGIETLQLGVRGDNHLAIELYEELGFREWGDCPMSSRTATSASMMFGCFSS
jgi:L-amino acid N-acyltransferase YncA